jgi:hypothetical protein
MEPTGENARQSRGLARFWPVHGTPAPGQRQSDQDTDEKPGVPTSHSGSAQAAAAARMAAEAEAGSGGAAPGSTSPSDPSSSPPGSSTGPQMVPLGSRRGWSGDPDDFPPPGPEHAPRHGGEPAAGDDVPRSPFAPPRVGPGVGGRAPVEGGRPPFMPSPVPVEQRPPLGSAEPPRSPFGSGPGDAPRSPFEPPLYGRINGRGEGDAGAGGGAGQETGGGSGPDGGDDAGLGAGDLPPSDGSDAGEVGGARRAESDSEQPRIIALGGAAPGVAGAPAAGRRRPAGDGADAEPPANGRAVVNGHVAPSEPGRPATGWATVPTSGVPTVTGQSSPAGSAGRAPVVRDDEGGRDGDDDEAGLDGSDAADRRVTGGRPDTANQQIVVTPGTGAVRGADAARGQADHDREDPAHGTGEAAGRAGAEDRARARKEDPAAGTVERVEHRREGQDGVDGREVAGIPDALNGAGGKRRAVPEDPARAPRRLASLADADAALPRAGRQAPDLPQAPAGRRPGDTGDAPLRPGDVNQLQIAFWDDEAVAHFRGQWHEVKAEFVDDPVAALTRAHDLLTDAVNELTEALLAERDELDPLRDTAHPDTESMRMAMRGYREFLDRILAL